MTVWDVPPTKGYVPIVICAIIVPCEDDYTDFKYWKENGWIGSVRPWI